MLYTLPWSRFKLTTSMVIGADSTGSWLLRKKKLLWEKKKLIFLNEQFLSMKEI
jgi:hypothetical protein